MTKARVSLLLSLLTTCVFAQEKNAAGTVLSLMQSEGEFRQIPFAEVVLAATGKKVIPLDMTREADRALVAKIGRAMDDVLRNMNATNSSARGERRINEVSAHFEDEMRRLLNQIPGFTCAVPVNASGKAQRSGYPDMRLADKTSGRIIYLDPKLYERGSRNSTLRTFYYEPKRETNKILDDAHHILVGFEHDGGGNGAWKFLNWELVDVSGLQVRLKAEFQGSNHDLYRPEMILKSSRKTAP